jgi:glycosyltransferase involved in cell wall biosynthesis
MPKLLKFDIIHPREYLEKKKSTWPDLENLSRSQYLQRLLALRSNYSDFYTYYLNQDPNWQAEEFFLLDNTYLNKTAQELFGSLYWPTKLRQGLSKKFRYDFHKWMRYVVDAYVQEFKPEVIFVRSHPLPSQFWQKYRKNSHLVARLSARLPQEWHPNDWDLIYTDQPTFKLFFELHGVKTILNDQGFDQRINAELVKREKQYETTFVGGLGTQNFLQRTEFFNQIAQNLPFKWWGYWWQYGGDGRQMSDFPALEKTYHGSTSGLEMYQIFRDSRVVVNDYVDTANGIGFNQRMFEVMGVGSFMLTRQAPNFGKVFPADIFVTYTDAKDCQDKAQYFLKNEKEREEIAANAQKFIAERYNYDRISAEFQQDLETMLSQP